MSQQSQPRWIWDPDTRQYFFYEAPTDTLVFQNGVRAPRPSHVPRTSFTSAATQAAGTASSANYASYSGGQNPNYVTGSSNQPYPPSTQSQGQRFAAQPSSSSAQHASQHPARTSSNAVSNVTQGIAGLSVQGQGTQAGPSRRALDNPTPIVPYVSERDGKRYVDVTDTTSQVRTILQTGPVESITDPNLYQSGVRATRFLLGTGGEEDGERLFPEFRRRDQPRRFFTIGKVFLVLWVEPAGESTTLVTNLEAGTSFGRFGERVYSKVRRFVVIRECDQYCSALPIASYGERGVGKPGVKKDDHSIIYTGKVAPQPLPGELPLRGEDGMRPQAIRVDPDDPTDKLTTHSRLDYGRVHTIQHNIKVRSFGKVNPKSMNALIHQFDNVWKTQPTGGLGHPPMQVMNAHQASRRSANLGRRDSQSARSGASGGSGSRQQQQREMLRRSRAAAADEDDSSDESEDARRGTGEPQHALQDAARRAVARLIQRGYTREQAYEAIRREAAAQRSRQEGRTRRDEDEDDDDDDDDDEESDSDNDVPTQGSARSRPSAGRESGQSRSVQTQARIQSTASAPGPQQSTSQRQQSSTAASQAQPRPGAVAQSQQPTSSTRQSGSGTAAQQPQSRSHASQSQPQASSSSQNTTRTQQSSSSSSSQTQAQAQAYLGRLIDQGYSRDEAAEIVRARFGRRRS